MIVIIDYGMGNLRSVQKAVERLGPKATITQSASQIKKAARLILPGVGAMKPAMAKLKSLGLKESIRQFIATGKPFLGICLGLQLLFETSNEGGEIRGLGILEGGVQRFQSLKVPHMGWNQLRVSQRGCPLLRGLKEGVHVYFCHSYFVQPRKKELIAAVTDYGREFCSAVHKDNIYGVQFHPEKSQQVGLKILQNFISL